MMMMMMMMMMVMRTIPDVCWLQEFRGHSCLLLKHSASPPIPFLLPFHHKDDEDDDDDNADDNNDGDDDENDDDDGTHCFVASCSSCSSIF